MSTYNVHITFSQRAEIASRFPSARCEKFQDGTTDVTLDTDDVDAFLEWCDANAIDAELV